MRNRILQAKVMSSIEEASLVKSRPVPSLDSTNEPSPKQRTPKERVIYPSEFPIEFGDFVNTSEYFGHKKRTKEVSPKVEPSKQWLMKVRRSSKAIRILSSSMTMPYSLRGTNIEALHNPTVRTIIMSEFLAKNLLGNMPLIPTNKLFKSPSKLIFECSGIVRDVPIEIDKIEVHLDFPHLCQPWVWSSHRLPFRQTFQRKTFSLEPWWEVWENCFRHSYLLPGNPNGEALS